MSDQPDRVAEAQRWFGLARGDLTLAELNFGDEGAPVRGACFWAQQAAEKAVKALMVGCDIDPPRSHDLEYLLANLPTQEAEQFGSVDLADVSQWAITGRYPAAHDANRVQAERALDIARSALEIVERRLGELFGRDST